MHLNCTTADDVLKSIKDKNVQMIDLRFTDLPGMWQHFSVPPSGVDAGAFAEGIGFGGSSIRGFQEIQESDMLVVPDPTTALLDPFASATTLVLICNIKEIRSPAKPIAATPDTLPRRQRPYVKGTGKADIAYFGPEAEFFVFNGIHPKSLGCRYKSRALIRHHFENPVVGPYSRRAIFRLAEDLRH